jgi:uncharacterized membrane protein
MADTIKSKPALKTDQVLSGIMLILAILGAIDSLYLLIYKLTGNNQMCLGNGGCHNVNFSPYSEIYGIPISLIGLIAYIVMALVIVLEPRLPILEENGPLILFGMSLIGVGFSVYLTYLELYVIHAICPFCVASAVIIVLLLVFAIIRLVKQTAS